MTISIGSLELLVLAVTAVVTLVMFLRGHAKARWVFAGLVCMALASVTTPADVFSMAILCFAFLATFVMGTRYRIHGLGGTS